MGDGQAGAVAGVDGYAPRLALEVGDPVTAGQVLLHLRPAPPMVLDARSRRVWAVPKTVLITALWELLAHVVEDVLLHDRADGRLLDNHEEVAPFLEADQPCTRNGGSSKFGIVVDLQCVVCGMEYQGRGTDRGNPLIWHRSLVVESSTGGSR